MKEDSVRSIVEDEIASAGIASKNATLLTRIQDGREYLVVVGVIDITDWDK